MYIYSNIHSIYLLKCMEIYIYLCSTDVCMYAYSTYFNSSRS